MITEIKTSTSQKKHPCAHLLSSNDMQTNVLTFGYSVAAINYIKLYNYFGFFNIVFDSGL